MIKRSSKSSFQQNLLYVLENALFQILMLIFICVGLITEKAMAPHSSTLAWKIPWTEEPGRLQSMGSRRVGHNWVTSLSLFTFMHWRRKWQSTPVFLPGESQGGGSLVAAVYGVAQSRTRLNWLSSSTSSLLGKELIWVLFRRRFWTCLHDWYLCGSMYARTS